MTEQAIVDDKQAYTKKKPFQNKRRPIRQ